MDDLITMGCGVVCPFLPHEHEEDWGLEDPTGKDLAFFRKVRDSVENKVKELITGHFEE